MTPLIGGVRCLCTSHLQMNYPNPISILEMKSAIQWKRFHGLIRKSITNTLSQQMYCSILKFLIIRIQKKKALIPFGTTQKFWNFNGISFVSMETPTHFFWGRVLFSTDGISKVNGLFYFSEWLFYFASFLKGFFQSNFGRDGFFKTWSYMSTFWDEKSYTSQERPT